MHVCVCVFERERERERIVIRGVAYLAKRKVSSCVSVLESCLFKLFPLIMQ